jgi:hypothetical protein
MSRCRLFVCSCVVTVLTAGVSSAADPATGGLETLYAWPEDPANLALNGSFELGTGSAPASWTASPGFARVTTGRYTGLWSLRLHNASLSAYPPTARQALNLAPGWYTFRVWAKPVNAGTNDRRYGGRLQLIGAQASTGLIRGSTSTFQLYERAHVNVLPGEATALRFEAYGKPNGDVYFDKVELHRLDPAPLEGFLVYPNYRGLLFQDRSQVIQVRATLRPQELALTAADLTVHMSLETPSGAVVAARVFTAVAGSSTLTLDAAAAPLGTLRLRLKVLRKSTSAVLYEYPTHRIVKLPASDRGLLETYVDTDNVMVLNGRRRFVLGIYDTALITTDFGPRIANVAEAPFDLYLNYWISHATNAQLRSLMNVLQGHGMSYIHTASNWYPGLSGTTALPPCVNGVSFPQGHVTYAECRANELGGEPGLAGWYTADERPATVAASIFEQYKGLRTGDPGGITYIAQNKVRELVRWRDVADVMGVDPYPIYDQPLGTLAPLEQVTDWVEQAQAAVERSRPVWPVIQFFKATSAGRFPTERDLRNMSYMAVIAGAKGLFYWSYGRLMSAVTDPALQQQYWQTLVRVTQEIRSLEPALISPDAPGVLPRVSPAGTVRVLAKQVGTTRYVFAVNNTATSGVRGTFTLAAAGARVDVVGEGRTVPLSGLSFSDTFDPYEAHVYKITAGGTSAAAPAAVSNGSFEIVATPGVPADWTLSTAAWRLTTVAHSGVKSLGLVGANTQSLASTARSKGFSLGAGSHRFSAYVKTQTLGTAGSNKGLRVCLRRAGTSTNAGCTAIRGGTTSWSLVSRDLAIPAAGTYTAIVEAYGSPSGSGWVDQVAVARLP